MQKCFRCILSKKGKCFYSNSPENEKTKEAIFVPEILKTNIKRAFAPVFSSAASLYIHARFPRPSCCSVRALLQADEVFFAGRYRSASDFLLSLLSNTVRL